jgi:magnesium chelatase family protein
VRRVSLARQGCRNALLQGTALDRNCVLGPAERSLLARSAERLCLSARAQARVRRVARTIADADFCAAIEVKHLAEALAYRGVPARH